MTPPFHDLLGEATRLTRSGQLKAATALVQRALQQAVGGVGPPPGAPPPSASGGLVVDAESRVVPDTPEPPPAAHRPPGGDPGATTRPAARPGAAASAEQWLQGRFTHRGRTLAYRLFVPALPADATPPMVVMLHGCTQDAADFAAGTRMNDLARDAGVLVLYPEQAAHANAHRCWNWFKPQHQGRERGEPAVLAALTQALVREHHVDATRVYAAGLSAGGAMAAILGSHHADLFAAVGVHSGLPAGAATDLPSALAAMRGGVPADQATAPLACPLIVFHGDADTTVHPRNGQALVESAGSAPDSARPAAQVTQGRSAGGQAYTRSLRVAPDGRNTVEHWLLHGAGHAWSGGSASGSYTDPAGVDASAEMLRFFLAHRRVASG